MGDEVRFVIMPHSGTVGYAVRPMTCRDCAPEAVFSPALDWTVTVVPASGMDLTISLELEQGNNVCFTSVADVGEVVAGRRYTVSGNQWYVPLDGGCRDAYAGDFVSTSVAVVRLFDVARDRSLGLIVFGRQFSFQPG
jgi:hypothetical protein